MEDQDPAGFTLVELALTLALLGIAVAMAVPAMTQFIDRSRVRGAAEQLIADFRFGRSTAIHSRQYKTVHISVGFSDNRWCYGLDYEEHCDCFLRQLTDKKRCLLRRRSGDDFPGIRISSARFSGRSETWFEGVRGTARAGHIELQGASGNSLQIKLSTLGRLRICSPQPGQWPAGYPAC